jgi:hypothetical protein
MGNLGITCESDTIWGTGIDTSIDEFECRSVWICVLALTIYELAEIVLDFVVLAIQFVFVEVVVCSGNKINFVESFSVY